MNKTDHSNTFRKKNMGGIATQELNRRKTWLEEQLRETELYTVQRATLAEALQNVRTTLGNLKMDNEQSCHMAFEWFFKHKVPENIGQLREIADYKVRFFTSTATSVNFQPLENGVIVSVKHPDALQTIVFRNIYPDGLWTREVFRLSHFQKFEDQVIKEGFNVSLIPDDRSNTEKMIRVRIHDPLLDGEKRLIYTANQYELIQRDCAREKRIDPEQAIAVGSLSCSNFSDLDIVERLLTQAQTVEDKGENEQVSLTLAEKREMNRRFQQAKPIVKRYMYKN